MKKSSQTEVYPISETPIGDGLWHWVFHILVIYIGNSGVFMIVNMASYASWWVPIQKMTVISTNHPFSRLGWISSISSSPPPAAIVCWSPAAPGRCAVARPAQRRSCAAWRRRSARGWRQHRRRCGSAARSSCGGSWGWGPRESPMEKWWRNKGFKFKTFRFGIFKRRLLGKLRINLWGQSNTWISTYTFSMTMQYYAYTMHVFYQQITRFA